MRAARVSLAVPYYDNPTMLAKQYETIAGYGPRVKKFMEFIVVDDGSPRWPAIGVKRPKRLPPVSIFRIGVDIRWNQDAARNIGAHEARYPWLFLTDIDHLVPENTIRRVIYGSLNPATVYRFSRVSAPEYHPYKPHPNSWALTREIFDKAGGYDERFAGFYGTDADFRDRVTKAALAVQMLPETLIRVPREVIPDASTTSYLRKEPRDGEAIQRIKAERAALGEWQPIRLTFPYERQL